MEHVVNKLIKKTHTRTRGSITVSQRQWYVEQVIHTHILTV